MSILVTPSKFLSPSKQPETEGPPGYNQQSGYAYADAANRPILLACSYGKARGMDAETGQELWTYDCPKGRFRIPTAIVEPPSAEEGREKGLVYIGCGSWIYCLKSRTGEPVWSRKISTTRLGNNFMTMTTPWSSRLAAEAYTSFNQNPVAQVRAVERDAETSAAVS